MRLEYPKWIPREGFDGPEILVKSADEHEVRNPEHYAQYQAEKQEAANAPSVDEQIQAAVERAVSAERARASAELETERSGVEGSLASAVAAERERCAKVAEGVGGRVGPSIAAMIRSGVEPSAEDQAKAAQEATSPQS